MNPQRILLLVLATCPAFAQADTPSVARTTNGPELTEGVAPFDL